MKKYRIQESLCFGDENHWIPRFPDRFRSKAWPIWWALFLHPRFDPPFLVKHPSLVWSFSPYSTFTILFSDGLKPQLDFNKPDAVRQQVSHLLRFIRVFWQKKTSVYLPIVDVKWPQQNMVPSAIQNTDNLWCFVSGPRPETVFVGWIKINLQYITDKLIGFIWFYKLEYPNHSLRASWSS